MKNHHEHNMDLEVDSEGTAFLIFDKSFSLFTILNRVIGNIKTTPN